MHKNDPLIRAETQARVLFEQYAKAASGHSHENVITAACNLFLNVLRQSNGNRTQALSKFDELSTKMRALLADNYDLTGKRLQGVFPFPQNIDVPLYDARPRR